MDLIDRLREIAVRIPKHFEHLQTEEATKTSLVLPFINALGYNVFDPTEVVPEFVADVGIKKGEKVDYAVMRDGKPIILIEAKAASRDLDRENPTQLYRYFSVTPARISILTNGIVYKFFSDLEEPNKMDSRPFSEFSMFELNEQIVRELKKFTKESFNLDAILSTATELKFASGIKRIIAEEWINPSEDLVKLFASRVYSGRLTQAVVTQFTQITKQAMQEFVGDRIKERLRTALERENRPEAPVVRNETEAAALDDAEGKGPPVITTEDEIEAFYVVKSILREVVEAKRVFLRDTASYCGILLDDNNRKPLCRLRFNTAQKYLVLLDSNKQETRHAIQDVNDIYGFAEQLKVAATRYLGKGSEEKDESQPQVSAAATELL